LPEPQAATIDSNDNVWIFELCHATVRSANFAERTPKLPAQLQDRRPDRPAGRLSSFAVERLGELLDSMR
jgi:hypothetical protein